MLNDTSLLNELERGFGVRHAADLRLVVLTAENAAAETVMGLYKNEATAKGSPFRIGPLRGIDDVETLTFEWVDWYNNRRLHGTLGNMPPEEYGAHLTTLKSSALNDEAANKKTA